ncbi:hypothetical protein [Geodermatophilus saharensis]|nr:hypothetical protein [Geodermatophilus saharensis]
MAWGADSLQVGLQLGVVSVSGTWRPKDEERRAAWELYVELVTRIAVVPLKPSQGLLREALTSLYSLFGITRDILRRYGPDIARPRPEGEYSFGELAVLVLNYELRPLLAHWHPMLDLWEAQRPTTQSRAGHEDAWEHANRLREELEQARQRLVGYADLLADAAGVPPLSGYPTP